MSFPDNRDARRAPRQRRMMTLMTMSDASRCPRPAHRAVQSADAGATGVGVPRRQAAPALVLGRSARPSVSMNAGAVMPHGKPSNKSLYEYVG